MAYTFVVDGKTYSAASSSAADRQKATLVQASSTPKATTSKPKTSTKTPTVGTAIIPPAVEMQAKSAPTMNPADVSFVVDGKNYIAPGGDRTKAVLVDQNQVTQTTPQIPQATQQTSLTSGAGVGAFTPAQSTNAFNAYYKDAQGNVFEASTGRNITQDEFQRLGLNIGHLNTKDQISQSSTSGSPYEQGFNAASEAGVGVPESYSGEFDLLKSYLGGGTSNGLSVINGDPYLTSLISSYQEFVNPQNQKDSLVQTYKEMLKESGIEGIDEELLNTKKIIEGTEDDIRTEVSKAGGFATESQVLALANARNKQLIKNYNNLLGLREARQSYLDTALNLEEKDRAAADRRFETAFNIQAQIAEYGQKMQQNAYDRLANLTEMIGLDGIYASVQGDPNAVRLIERTLGMPSGALAQGAMQAQRQRTAESTMDNLKLQLAQEQLLTEKAQRAKIYADMADTSGGGKKLTAEQSKALGYGSRLVQSGNIINAIGDQFASTPQTPNISVFGLNLTPGFLKSSEQKQFEQAKRNFINAVLRRESGAAISSDEFESAEQQYFPKLGDDDGTLAQKEENRALVTRNFLTEGGLSDVDPRKLIVSPGGELVELTD